MKKMLSLTALGMAALGTTLWAQQGDDPPPAKAAAEATPGRELNDDRPLIPPRSAQLGPAELAEAAAAGALPPLPSSSATAPQPARANVRPASPGNRSSGGGRSIGGPAVAPRSDLNMTSVYGPATPYAPGGSPGMYQTPRYPTQTVISPDGTQYIYTAPDGRQEVRQFSTEEMRSTQEFRKTVEALRTAKSDEEKADLRAKLNELVSKQIDQDLMEREKRLTELEAKAQQLREQLQQRKQTKAEIQKMLVMLIENPQGGLGLPPAWMNAINTTDNQIPRYGYPPPAGATPYFQPLPATYPINVNYNAQ